MSNFWAHKHEQFSRSNEQFPAMDFGTMQMVSVRRTQNEINYSFTKIAALCIKI